MNPAVTIRRQVRFRATAHGGRQEHRPAVLGESSGRIPRVARLTALAIRLEALLAEGTVPNSAALADLAHVTRARITQITNLTLLAPDIQEAILFLPPVRQGRDPLTERDLRPLVAEPNWTRQRVLWDQLRSSDETDARTVKLSQVTDGLAVKRAVLGKIRFQNSAENTLELRWMSVRNHGSHGTQERASNHGDQHATRQRRRRTTDHAPRWRSSTTPARC